MRVNKATEIRTIVNRIYKGCEDDCKGGIREVKREPWGCCPKIQSRKGWMGLRAEETEQNVCDMEDIRRKN